MFVSLSLSHYSGVVKMGVYSRNEIVALISADHLLEFCPQGFKWWHALISEYSLSVRICVRTCDTLQIATLQDVFSVFLKMCWYSDPKMSWFLHTLHCTSLSNRYCLFFLPLKLAKAHQLRCNDVEKCRWTLRPRVAALLHHMSRSS